MGFTLTAIIIAVLAGVGAYFAWSQNRMVAIACGVVCAVASSFAIIAAFVKAVALIFKLLPILLLVLAIWLIYRAVTKRRHTNAAEHTYRP
ncbi:hypothetical protein [Dietzia sp.]|uniref:hypothetical protein n=1 Tax=Dietzia sp. TaxID=1871616 RepID=UPI002FD8A84B